MKRDDLFGRWKIVSWIQRYDDGRVTFPLGEKLKGFVDYGEAGMFLVIERASRSAFVTGGQWNADVTEKAQAYDAYLSYAGDYDVEGDVVNHHVRHCLFPNWEGGLQRRTAVLEGDTLQLVARLESGTSEARTATLEWRRDRALT